MADEHVKSGLNNVSLRIPAEIHREQKSNGVLDRDSVTTSIATAGRCSGSCRVVRIIQPLGSLVLPDGWLRYGILLCHILDDEVLVAFNHGDVPSRKVLALAGTPIPSRASFPLGRDHPIAYSYNNPLGHESILRRSPPPSRWTCSSKQFHHHPDATKAEISTARVLR